MGLFKETSFKQKFKDRRLEMGWSQSECAENLGFKPAAISHFETGRRKPSFENLVKICEGFQLSPNEIMGWMNDN